MSKLSVNDAVNFVVGGVGAISTAVTNIFQEFQGTMNRILPKLNNEEQQQVFAAIGRYSSFLMKTQEFISCTLVGVRYAETLEHLCKAVPTETMTKLIDEVQSLLQKFHELQTVIKKKVKEESSLLSFKNIMMGMCALGIAIVLIGTGVGAVLAVSAGTLKTIAVVGGATALVGASGAAIAHAAQKISDFGQVMDNLQKIRDCLVIIAQEQSTLKGKHEGLNNLGGRTAEQEKIIVKDMAAEFTAILNSTQVEVTKGFNILKRF